MSNPCCEIALRPYQFCNLCEVNVSDIESQEDLNQRVKEKHIVERKNKNIISIHQVTKYKNAI